MRLWGNGAIIDSFMGVISMKRNITLVLVFALIISLLAGCGSSDSTSTSTSASEDGSSYGINLTGTEVQQMSEERASKEKLEETVAVWLGNSTIFPESSKQGKLTYKDFVDYIGSDATEYYFDGSRNARVYTWKADGADNSKLAAWFVERGNSWRLSITGSTNL